MDKTKKKKVQMPSGIRSKLTAAIAMLLISSLLVVGSTYAWFTLSTAPEVTGITTSVGANGNLEIALLNGVKDGAGETDTFADMSKIKSNVGDSFEATADYTKSNITWGNLVDLSTAYGLESIKLYPAALNVDETGNVVIANMLRTPVYGADGRVKETEANAVSTVYKDGAFTYAVDTASYGARAIGVASDITPRQETFASAKTTFNSYTNASNPVSAAVAANAGDFVAIAMRGVDGTADYSDSEMAAMAAIARSTKTSLESIVKAYANAGLAFAASKNSGITDEAVATLKTAVANVTSAATLKGYLNTAGVSTYDGVLDTLATAQTNVAGAITYFEDEGSSKAADAVNPYVKQLIGNSTDITAYNAEGGEVTPISTTTASSIKSLYVGGGAIGTIADQTGIFTLMDVTFPYTITVYGGKSDTTSALATVKGTVDGYVRPDGAATTTISDTYGYILDFAFRTNASSSNLLLQTAAANRVYTDGSAATQGKGSNVEFAYDATGLKAEQALTLLNAIKLVFINPDSGAIYAKASLTGIAATTTKATADITLDDGYDKITALEQNTATKVSVLVYLDGDKVDNTAVVNAATSGSLKMNLQFASSATLQPMQNTALKNK